MKDYLPTFTRVVHRARSSLKKAQVGVIVGHWLESDVLKLQRKHWVGDVAVEKAGRSEIFFSVWTNEKGRKANRAFYNIHALRLRAMRGYSLQSHEFASSFRSRFAPQKNAWPNVSVDHGPQTLIEGWIDLDESHLEESIINLLTLFIPLADVVDELLAERKGR